MRKRNFQKILAVSMMVMLILTACQNKQNQDKVEKEANLEPITVSAAASLKETMDVIGEKYDETVEFNMGGSGTLRTQIESGAPVDVFISASKEHVSKLEEKNLVKESQDLLKNKLVIVGKEDLNSLDDLLNVGKFAIGEPESVPAGKYAKEALTNLGLFENMQDKIVFGSDVRNVLEWVKSGEVDYGVVYKTDALTAKDDVEIVYEFEEGTHKDIIYPVALLNEKPESKNFYDYLKGEEAKKVFEEYGYEVIDGVSK
ncbi:molybdate transport system substrate-binding protein [Peptoniphilus asaccharolyticus DSM 20463]|uniref:Molybdate transport system substrate-binding protein n=1 Tax=Peptoniphilus asaccharolyticus DSM 20463 TaxID=573058 RepID=A0A1W1VAY5_PEPAS|nr:molybdate ABC transporter substrate-binding protein [Peptoniphilus asaccharolyticus]MBL7575701.1 molybdate ABC transporter substrate-binding protein [Peptoniphilus asaccharolyticus]SMB90475.1 molybdate transport system substrate-binding protein [Peptoniphilus asaccharolyticus DSM 20463]